MLEVLDVDATDGSTVYVVDSYWLHQVWRLTSLVDNVIRWWTPLFVGGVTAGDPRDVGVGEAKGMVETSPWSGNWFWRTISGGPGGPRLG